MARQTGSFNIKFCNGIKHKFSLIFSGKSQEKRKVILKFAGLFVSVPASDSKCIRMSRNDPSRLLRDNLETAAKVTIMQHTWLRTGRRYPIVLAEKQLNKCVFDAICIAIRLPCLPSHKGWVGGGRGEEFTPFLSLFVTKVLKGQDPPFLLSGTLPYPPLPWYAPNPPTPLLPQDLDPQLNQLFCCYFSLT